MIARMSKGNWLVAVVLAGGLLAASTSAAASRDMERLQLQVSGLQGQVTDLQRQVEDLQRELRRLNESLAEQNANQKKSLQEQQAREESILALLRDLQEKLAEVNALAQRPAAAVAAPVEPGFGAALPPTVPGAPVAPGGVAGAPPASAPAPRELYSQAYADFARGNYDLAIQGFQEYLRAYPATDFSDNAQYWIGECLYGKQRYQEAIDSWKLLYRDFPSSDKLPDAHVKSGMAYEKLGRRSQALVEFRFVVDRYPNTQAARIARDRLNPN